MKDTNEHNRNDPSQSLGNLKSTGRQTIKIQELGNMYKMLNRRNSLETGMIEIEWLWNVNDLEVGRLWNIKFRREGGVFSLIMWSICGF